MENEYTILDLWVSNLFNRDGFYNSDDIKVIADNIKSIAALVLTSSLRHTSTKEVKKNLQVLTRQEGNGDVHLKINYHFADSLQMKIDYDEFTANVKEKIKSLMIDATECAENIKKSGNKNVKIIISSQHKSECSDSIESNPATGDIKVSSPLGENLIKNSLDLLSNMPDKAAIYISKSKKEHPIATSATQRIKLSKKEGHKHASHNFDFKGKIDGVNDKENTVIIGIKDSFGSENKISLKTKSADNFNLARLNFCKKKEVAINIAQVGEGSFYIESIKDLFVEMDL